MNKKKWRIKAAQTGMSVILTAALVSGCGQAVGTNSGNATEGIAAASSEAAGTGGVAASSAEAGWDTSKDDVVTVSVINNFYTAGEKKLAEEYTGLHPETKVVIDVVSDNDAYKTKMVTSLSGDRKAAPDIVHGNFVGMALGNNNTGLAVEKGYLYDMTAMLDEENPYNGGKVRDAFNEEDLALALSEAGGKYITWLPFDKIGFALFYNQDLFEKEGIAVPNSFETFIDACQKFKDKGYDIPVAAGMESFRLANTIADAAYRNQEEQFLVQPEDALWNEETMAANKDFKFDDTNLYSDQFTVFSVERQMKYATENGIGTDLNKKIYETFYTAAQYFPANWISGDSTEAITDFESQTSPMLYQASFNAGLILSDINQLPESAKFNWGTTQIAKFDNPPEGFGSDLRGYWDFGNIMSIVPKDDEDHMARVKDFYKFWYSADNAKLCYEETLNNGNFVQGPCVINNVKLSDELEQLLKGFESSPSKEWAFATGMQWNTAADAPVYHDLMNGFASGEIGVDEFLTQMQTVYDHYNQEQIKNAGFDLDPATPDQAN
ncbi:ABC transporter substrate-binding protein [Lachnoclostridium sp. Marseille-P6806]|uniref:ABC transporter substrate-binding protein n=1 Tax=Lachnoclostridium sp. Marseille-P6806 TaxID=2364793 RepID=UPI0010314FB5|nr:extracellular solute-binding protein [Lachnoclostridium sp. Marseille-P6806]